MPTKSNTHSSPRPRREVSASKKVPKRKLDKIEKMEKLEKIEKFDKKKLKDISGAGDAPLPTKDSEVDKEATEELPKPQINVNIKFEKLAMHLRDWINKNSQPKTINYSKYIIKREPTRWAKRGPMTRRDWVHFYNWAATNALPKELPVVTQPAKPEKEKKGKSKQQAKTKMKLEQIIEAMDKLATPKKPRKKYVYPPKPVYPYSPQIHVKMPPRIDKGRPFPPPHVPRVFQHIEIESEFWTKLRFPIRPSTRNYVPTANVLRLSIPRILPPAVPHCPIPEKPAEYVSPRRRMSYRQWREHKRRLEYLAKPVYRPLMPIYFF